jgi:hypothetical protein
VSDHSTDRNFACSTRFGRLDKGLMHERVEKFGAGTVHGRGVVVCIERFTKVFGDIPAFGERYRFADANQIT